MSLCQNRLLLFLLIAYVPVQISPDGIASRDEKVFRFARERNTPLIMLTSGSTYPLFSIAA